MNFDAPAPRFNIQANLAIPVSVLPRDRDGAYDGKMSPSKSLFESLRAKEGDQVRVEIVTGGGLFG